MIDEAKKAIDIIKGAEVIQRGGKYVAIPYGQVSTILSALEAERAEIDGLGYTESTVTADEAQRALDDITPLIVDMAYASLIGKRMMPHLSTIRALLTERARGGGDGSTR